MTTHKEQNERVVLIRFNRNVGRRGQLLHRRGRGGFPAPSGYLAAQVIGHAPRGDLKQPGAGVIGNTFPRPLPGGSNQRFLNRVLDGREIMETSDEHAEHLRREFPQQMLGMNVPRNQ